MRREPVKVSFRETAAQKPYKAVVGPVYLPRPSRSSPLHLDNSKQIRIVAASVSSAPVAVDILVFKTEKSSYQANEGGCQEICLFTVVIGGECDRFQCVCQFRRRSRRF